jgi:hypothetical protein
VGDLFTHPGYGLGLLPSSFDTNSWFAAADALFLNYQHLKTYVSPLYNEQIPSRQAIADMSLVADLWLRFNPATERIEAGVFRHGTDIPIDNLPLITADDLTEKPKFEGIGWGETQTGWTVTFTDAARGYKDSSEKHDDLRAMRILGESRRASLQRPSITRRDQAHYHASEYGKSKGQPATKGELLLRRTRGLNIRPGDLIRVDIDVQPGGLQLQQVFRVLERTIPPTGAIRLRIEAELSIAPVTYIPEADLPDAPQESDIPAISSLRIIEIPEPLDSGNIQMGILAERPHDLVTGINVYYDAQTDGTFQFLGVQNVFALRAAPVSGWDANNEGPFAICLQSNRDKDMLDDDPGPTAARDNQLLMICLSTTDSGSIAEDDNGFALIEFYSIESLQQTSSNTFEVTALRGRLGSWKQAFSVSNTEIWILPLFGMKGFSHADFFHLQTILNTGYFRAQPFSLMVQPELSACENIPFRFPTSLAYAPRVRFTSPASDTMQYGAPPGNVEFRGVVEDADSNMTHFALLKVSSSGVEETLFSAPLYPTGYYAFEHTTSFSETGNFTIIARAQDSSGRTSDDKRFIHIAAPLGQVATPLMQPPAGIYATTTLTVSITCATPLSQIYYKLCDDLSESSEVGSYLPYTGILSVPISKRIWAVAFAEGYTNSNRVASNYISMPIILGGGGYR